MRRLSLSARRPDPLVDAAALVGPNPSKIGGFDGLGFLKEGGPANFMIFNARSPNEVLSRAHHHRVIFRNGERLEAVLPDYDDLLEATA
jgi:cytosine/creatinine deaminase